jgi:hypothetical protein
VQVELAWAYYRQYVEQDDLAALNTSLGVLHTLNSPFFNERYLVEPALLEAQVLYHFCRFKDGSVRIEEFVRHYSALRDRLRSSLKNDLSNPGATLSTVLGYRRWSRGEGQAVSSAVPTCLLDLNLNRPGLDRLERHLDLLAVEKKRLDAYSAKWAPEVVARLRKLLVEHEDAVLDAYDRSLKMELYQTYRELNGLLKDAQMLKLSLLSAEQDLYEAAAAGNVPHENRSRKRLRRRWPSGDRQVWPFDGEYWVDELGHYQSRVTPLCPD